jgi:hypothetical protein
MGIKDWFTTERVLDTEKLKQGVKTWTGSIFLKNILGFIVKIVVGISAILVVLFLLVGFTIFTFRTFSTGTSDVFVTKLGVALSSFPLGQSIKAAFTGVFGVMWNPEQILEPGMKTEVDSNSARNLGIRFTKLRSEPGNFLENSDFTSYGNVEITPFEKEKDSMNVRFKCDVDGVECTSVEPDVVGNIYGTETQSLTISCDCNSGVAKKTLDGKKVALKGQYDFVTRGYLTIYTMSQKKLDASRATRGNVFEGITNSHLNKQNGVVSSTYTAGPLKLAIGSAYSQPFTERGPGTRDNVPYTLVIELGRTLSSIGIPIQMKALKIFIPSALELDTENDVFITSDEETEEGFTAYELSPTALKELNSPCKKTLGILDDLTNPKCREIWTKGFLPVEAKIRVSNVDKGDLMEHLLFVETDYIYEESIYDDIIVRKYPAGGAVVTGNEAGGGEAD